MTFPAPPGPMTDERARNRVVRSARDLIGLAYRHHHVPDYVGRNGSTGLDCSNFTAWVYNVALGIRFTSDVHRQAETAGRELRCEEQLQPGDLIFIRPWHAGGLGLNPNRVSHVAIVIEPAQSTGCRLDPRSVIIDSHRQGVSEHRVTPWYVERFALARRVIDE